jgi:polyisoprenoid-binding protein YceI
METPTSTTAVAVPAAGTYAIDPARSKVEYTGRHMFGLGVVHAAFSIVSGELTVTDPPVGSRVEVLMDASSFTSNNAKRDKDVRSAPLLDVAAYPDITFESEGLRQKGDHWQLSGTVTAHGRAVPVEVMIDQLILEGGGVRVHARAAHLDRQSFGITGSKGMVGRYLDLDLDAYAVPA